MPELDLRNDVYRRPLQTALERLGVVARLALRRHRGGRWGRNRGSRRSGRPQGPGLRRRHRPQPPRRGRSGRRRRRRGPGRRHHPGRRRARPAGESGPRLLPVPPHARRRPAAPCCGGWLRLRRPGGWLLAQEPITSAGRVAGVAMSMPSARHPDIGALLPGLVRDAGLELVDAWAEAQAGAGPGPVAGYLEDLTGVSPGTRPRGPAPASHRDGPKANHRHLVTAGSRRSCRAQPGAQLFQPSSSATGAQVALDRAASGSCRPCSLTTAVRSSAVRHLHRHSTVERPLEELLPELVGQQRAPLEHGPDGYARLCG